MRNKWSWFLPLLGLGLMAMLVLPATAADSSEQIARLIKQLGSSDWGEQEHANRALYEIGPPALEALRKACSSDDVEVRRRASSLTGAILVLPTTAADRNDPEQIARLIKQLGSSNLAERDDASHVLKVIGPPALEALRKACTSDDAEVRRLAGNLVYMLEKHLLSAKILAPTRIHLKYQDTPIQEAVADLAKQLYLKYLDMPIQEAVAKQIKFENIKLVKLVDPPGGWTENRKVTLDTGETTFWEAFDQFCQKAGVEIQPQPISDPWISRKPPKDGGPAPGVAVEGAPAFLLIDAKPQTLPTCYAGAVRIRALPGNARLLPGGGQPLMINLEVMPEPKPGTTWHNPIRLKIDKAVDDQGQELSQMAPGEVRNYQALGVRRDIPFGSSTQILVPVQFKNGAKKSNSLKELSGTISALVQTRSEPLVVDLNIVGQKIKGKEGGAIKVLEVTKSNDAHFPYYPGVGGVQIRIQLELPPGVQHPGDWTEKLWLQAEKRQGQAYLHTALQTGVAGNPAVYDITMTAISAQDRERGVVPEVPAKLTFSSPHYGTVAIPFTLKDVKLQ